jgi:hypothetical protein
MKKEDKLKSKLNYVGARLLDLVDGDPTTRGHGFWRHINLLIEMIKKDVSLEAFCFGCNHIKPRAIGWQRKEVRELGVVLVCPDCLPPRSCRVCKCTDADCSGCAKKTGAPCHWVEQDLCSACQGATQ